MYTTCVDCGKEKSTPKAQKTPRCLSCKNKAVAKHQVFHECPSCGRKRDRGRSDRMLCRSCAAKERWQSAEFRQKIAVSFQSEAYTVERWEKIRAVAETEESKAKRSASNKASWTPERRKRHSEIFSHKAREYWREVYRVERWEDIPREYNGFTEALRKHIRDRHNNKCAICGRSETIKLDVHHIDYDKSNASPENLIALCHGCHTRTNHKRKFWQQLFTSYMENVPFEMMAYIRATL